MSIRCSNCGAENDNDALICVQCAKEIRPADENNQPASAEAGNGIPDALLIAISVIIVLLLCALVAFFVLRDDAPKKTENNTTASVTSSTTVSSTTTTAAETTTSTTTTTTAQPSSSQTERQDTPAAADGIPAQLAKYKDGLVKENRKYKIDLGGNSSILCRSAPIYKKGDKSNVVARMPSGAEILVEYIYKSTWVVYKVNGQYVFSSLYAENDPSKAMLMKPVS